MHRQCHIKIADEVLNVTDLDGHVGQTSVRGALPCQVRGVHVPIEQCKRALWQQCSQSQAEIPGSAAEVHDAQACSANDGV
jgi:hypothetical protein